MPNTCIRTHKECALDLAFDQVGVNAIVMSSMLNALKGNCVPNTHLPCCCGSRIGHKKLDIQTTVRGYKLKNILGFLVQDRARAKDPPTKL